MEPGGLLSCSQKPSTDPYPEPVQYNQYVPILSKINFNVIHPPSYWCALAFPQIYCMHSLHPILATYLANLIFLDFIIRNNLLDIYNFTKITLSELLQDCTDSSDNIHNLSFSDISNSYSYENCEGKKN
jgi:hypothetical protein